MAKKNKRDKNRFNGCGITVGVFVTDDLFRFPMITLTSKQAILLEEGASLIAKHLQECADFCRMQNADMLTEKLQKKFRTKEEELDI